MMNELECTKLLILSCLVVWRWMSDLTYRKVIKEILSAFSTLLTHATMARVAGWPSEIWAWEYSLHLSNVCADHYHYSKGKFLWSSWNAYNFKQQRCKSIVIFFSKLLTCLSAMMLFCYLCTNAGKKETWQDTNTRKVLWFKRWQKRWQTRYILE